MTAVWIASIALGCGGPKTQQDTNSDGTVHVRGRISVRGSTPGSLIVLEGQDGKLYEVQASAVGEELRSLDGMNVFVEALVLPGAEQQEPVLSVRYYDLLALPSGETPIVGYVRASQDEVWLYDQNEVAWLISGQFVDVFSTFAGAKVWVVGVTQRKLDTRVSSVRTLFVTEYGVIRQY
jgi:hypothetical protein